MSWIGRAISSVGQYYKEINPATLSGAIDVIVVENKRPASKEKKDDSPSEELIDLACSPWHVRFGKLSVLRPVERKVRILINGEPAPFSMKIGDTGEAFFVFETDVEDLPDDLQTSPLVSPVLKSTDTPSARAQDSTTHQTLETVPDFADLGEPQLESSQVKRNPSRDPPQKGQDDPPPTSLDNEQNSTSLEPMTNECSQEEKPEQKVPSDQPDLTSDENSWLREGELAPSLKRGLEGSVSESPQHDSVSAGKMKQSLKLKRSNSIPDSSAPQADRLDEVVPHTASSLPTADLMLDMDGYKMPHEAPHRGERNPGDPTLDPSSRDDDFNDDAGDSDDKREDPTIDLQENLVMEFTTALLRCSETINRCFFGASGSHPELETNENVIVHVAENEPGSGGATENDCDGLIIVEEVEDKNGFRGFDRFKIQSNGTWHVFEISLFSVSHDDQNPAGISSQRRTSRSNHSRHYNHQKFKENRLTFEDFFGLKSDPAVEGSLRKDLLDDETNFIVRYNERYTLTWENASTALTSLGICRKSVINLSQAQLNKVVRSASRNETSANGGSSPFLDGSKSGANGPDRLGSDNSTHPDSSSPQPSPSYTRPWTRWWYRSDRLIPTGPNHQRMSSAASADTWSQDKPVSSPTAGNATSIKVSPPTSPPDTPRSMPGTTCSKFVSDEKIGPTGDESANKPSSSAATLDTQNQASEQEDQSTGLTTASHKTYAKTLRLTSDQLKQLGLKKGVNQVSFSVRSSYSGYAVCTSRIFLWEADYKICISDIDGTITKSDALGHVFNMIGRDWTHAGVAKLYTDIARNGYKVMYLTSRAIGQANTTREYLKGINQMGFVLPEGPVIMSPDRLMTSLHREVIMRKPEVFKMACLRDIKRLFGQTRSPFYAGFGNRITDALSYRAVDVPSSRIFTIDSNGEVKMELLELTGYKSSYIHMTDLVDQMFPPVNRNPATPEYSDFNYWRSVGTSYDALSLIGVDLDELLSPQNGNLIPVSPTLSARSGETTVSTSRLSFRLSSLSLGRKSSKADLPGSSATLKSGTGSSKASFLTVSSSKRAHSPTRFQNEPESVIEQDEDADDDALGSGSDDDDQRHVPARLRSDSMPGSLPGSVEEASLLESLRRGHYQHRSPQPDRTDNEQSIDKRENPDDETPGDEDEFPQMDFSSVPYL
ncbi:hypothetical protein PTTG_05454 [Puccinia triticina 1-1 BBBD Race 1]|uniref:LNS2 domain-containing protein n=2 Tax=Puccinia triticina TaxID=208348 RepID=A0A180GTV8_PUCT1|nr:hypothetical protein PTTG_05454 [Puccinia triticina 1-1 BBBD Race 1]